MIVLITGATGLIGGKVVKYCHDVGFKVHYLTTSKAKLIDKANYKGFYWNPKTEELDIKCFEGVEAIIHLVGASISKRWTSAYKKEVLESRTLTTKLLYTSIKQHNITIKHVVAASAIGIYPSSLVNYYEEKESEVSNSFLGDVVLQWEEAVDAFASLNIKVAKIRIGLVLAKEGGALPEMVRPIRYGLGAAFGNGKQWQSWIHVEDLARLFVFVLQNHLEGIYNGVAPNPVSNSEFTKMTAKVLRRPLILPNVPRFIMKAVLGEMHMLLFESQRVSSKAIESKGFHFEYANLKPALTDLLR